MKKLPLKALCVGLLLPVLLVGQSSAQVRRIQPIATPEAQEQAIVTEQNIEFTPISRNLITQAVEQIVEHWNARDLEPVLGEQFFDRERLKQSMDTVVPRDATLRVQAVRDIQTLRQYVEAGESGRLGSIVSVVSATVETQIEYNTGGGFVRLPGVNEFIMEIRTPE